MKQLQRIWRALRRDEDVFFEIGMDKKANIPAFLLVNLVGLTSGAGWVLRSESPFLLLASLLVAAPVAWLVFAGCIRFLEMIFEGGGMERNELLRLAGFAALPLAFLSVPYVGWLSVVWFWSLMYTAIRSLYSMDPPHALALVWLGNMVAFVAWGLTMLLVNTVLTSLVGI